MLMDQQINGANRPSLDEQLVEFAKHLPQLQTSDSPLGQQWMALCREISQREQTLMEMTTLYEGSQAIGSALSEQQIFDALFDQICDQNPASISVYFFQLVNDEPLWAELKSSWQKDKKSTFPLGHRFYLPEAIEMDWLTTDHPLFIEDVAQSTDLTEPARSRLTEIGATSTAILPFITADKKIGAILVYFTTPFHFSELIRRFWQAITRQTAVLLANRQLIQEVTYRVVQIETGADIAHTASSILDLNQILNTSVTLIRDRFKLYYVGVFLVDQAEKWAVLRAGTGEAGQIQIKNNHRLAIGGESMIGWCLAHQKARIALDVGKDAEHFQNPHLPGTRSEMALPLIYHGQSIGALTVQSAEPAAFNQADIVFLQTMAGQLANAIQNARLFEQAKEEIEERRRIEQEILQRNNELAAINRVTQAITSALELEQVLRASAREMAQIFNARTCGIGLLNPAQTELQIVADFSLDPQAENSEGTIIPVSNNPSSMHVINTGKTLVIDSPQTHPMTAPIHELMRVRQTECLMIVPLQAGGRVIGTIGLDSAQPNRHFTNTEVSLMETLGGQVTIAIEKAQLFEETQQQLEALKQAEQDLQANKSLVQAIIDNAEAPIYVLDKQGRFLLANEQFAKGFGFEIDHIIGKTDFELFPEDIAENYQSHDLELLESESRVREEEAVIQEGELRHFVTIKFPLYDTSGEAYALCGIATNITERKQAERALQEAFERTQSLYRINNTLATQTGREIVFETILREHLNLLELERGGLVLLQDGYLHSIYVEGAITKPAIGLPVEQRELSTHLLNSQPLIINDIRTHPLTRDNKDLVDKVTAILFIPLVIHGKIIGVIEAEATQPDYIFTQSKIEIGQAIADQLAIWLENKQLQEETQHHSTLLRTGAEVSKVASSILDVDNLIEISVNVIRDKFDFYYVGLFLVDSDLTWATLRAGTGEAGQIQLKRNHRLAIGGESMIGWSIAHRQARIALDVGEDAVQFKNPDLPLTRSEMALPLISRDEVIGALTVQSIQPGAFSIADTTFLQMMADQLANAIKNARLFQEINQAINEVSLAQSEAEERLQETIALQQLSQALSSTLNTHEILDIFFRACTNLIGFDYIIFSQVNKKQNRMRVLAAKGVSDRYIQQTECALDSHYIVTDILQTGRFEVIRGWDERLDRETFDAEKQTDWTRLYIPISLRQENVGLVEAGFKKPGMINETQTNLIRAFIDQTILALDNAQRYELSQKQARRETLIKEITTRVWASNDVDTILRTTVKELGNALNSKRSYAHLTSSNPNVIVDRE